MWNQHHPLARACWLILLFLVGCSPVTQTSLTTVAAGPTITPTSISVLTKTPIITSTFVTTKTPTPINTPLPPTPIPTFPEATAQVKIGELLKTNGNCRLPCWWGISPGITKWENVKSLFQLFGLTIEQYKNTFSVKAHLEHDIELTQMVTIKDDIVNSIYLSGRTINNNQLIFGDPNFQQVFSHYLLPDILNSPGKPEYVWLRTFPGAPEGGDIPYYIVLDYPDNGITVLYRGNVIQTANDKYKICPQNSDVHLYLWSPAKSDPSVITKSKSSLFLSQEDFSKFLSIEDATETTLDDFQNTYTNPLTKACLETKSTIWAP